MSDFHRVVIWIAVLMLLSVFGFSLYVPWQVRVLCMLVVLLLAALADKDLFGGN